MVGARNFNGEVGVFELRNKSGQEYESPGVYVGAVSNLFC